MKRKTAIDPYLRQILTNPFLQLTNTWQAPNFPTAKARRLWSLIRDETIAEWSQRMPGKRPWPYWRFDQGMDPPGDQEQYLRKHGLLTDEEKTIIERRSPHVVQDPRP